MALLIILVLSLFLNVSLIRRGGVKSAVAAACLNAVPIGMALAVVLANPGRTWTDRLSWISAGLLLDGLMAGWALRLWNLRRLLAWAACFALAAGGIWSGERYQQSLWEDSNRFNPQTEGLLQVRTVHEIDQSFQYNTLASGQRIMNTEAFAADPLHVYTVSGFQLPDNSPGQLRVVDEKGKEIPVSKEINTICHAMKEIGHHVLQCRILRSGDEWFASAMLNVNLWTPYHFYYFNRQSGKLVHLYTFNGRDVDAIHILSPERLHALRQESIGGWQEDEPQEPLSPSVRPSARRLPAPASKNPRNRSIWREFHRIGACNGFSLLIK